MSTFKESIKDSLFSYPSLYNGSTWDVCCQFFTTLGNGMKWTKDGELTENFDHRNNSTMYFNDLEEEYNKIIEDIKEFGESDHYQLRLIKNKAMVAQRKFVEENIDILSSTISANPYSGEFIMKLGHYEEPKGVCYNHAIFFNYPDNIKDDWSKAMYEFGQLWLTALRSKYRNSNTDANELITRIQLVMTDLRSKFTGKTVKELEESDTKLCNEIIAQYNELREKQKNVLIS